MTLTTLINPPPFAGLATEAHVKMISPFAVTALHIMLFYYVFTTGVYKLSFERLKSNKKLSILLAVILSAPIFTYLKANPEMLFYTVIPVLGPLIAWKKVFTYIYGRIDKRQIA